MVSFTLDAVKFLLIYRYLQNTYWFKRGASLPLVPHSEGSYNIVVFLTICISYANNCFTL